MRFEVPQFIEIEDKIVGPFTWKQFVFLAGGAGIIIILLKLGFIFFVVIGIPVAALSASLAFHRVNNRPFLIFLESFLTYTTKKKLYLWRKDQPQIVVEKGIVEKPHTQELAFAQKRSIAALSRKLEVHIPTHEK
jgi:PrgI family protein